MHSVRAYKMIFAVLHRQLIQLLIKWWQFFINNICCFINNFINNFINKSAAILDFVIGQKWCYGMLRPVHAYLRTKFGEDTSNSGWVMEIGDFPFFQNGSRPPSQILLRVENDITALCRLSISITTLNLVTVSQMVAELLQFSVFQNGGRPPFWILL